MLTYIAKAEGSVSPTVVIDGAGLGEQPLDIIPELHKIKDDLSVNNESQITKYAVIKPSNHPMYDIDYLFFQLIPGNPCRFDYAGSCGHSILAAINVAIKWGWIPTVSPGLRVRVNIKNVGDSLVCEIDQISRTAIGCTAHFIEKPGTKLGTLLPTGQTKNIVKTPLGNFECSIVSAGNPYVFVSCLELGIESEEQLFNAGNDVFTKLQEIRYAASNLLGWDPESVFPKIAVLGRFRPDTVSVRAISVPKWHPTMALTGVACLGVSASMKGTVAYDIASQCFMNNNLKIQTSGGTTAVSSATTGNEMDDYLLYNSISNKKVELVEPNLSGKKEELNWKQSQKILA
ncbi:hypothetical protein EJ131_31780 [Bacillus mycoides]|uniref:PrpF domain-containing protein n=1 Tax=Bacillus TaxID=1386 RepID=UPI001912E29D|nr:MULTISPECIES: PrpF domain-containing protein [Bacillus]MBK5432176.1 hypothetical protein [Bacillus sp. TH25]MCZ6944940.1 hypothetical protein [Bacillus mycoides]